MRNLILATASPRRVGMLHDLGIVFKAVKSKFNEPRIKKGQLPFSYVEENARGKAFAVAAKLRNSVVIGSDTVVVYRNRVLGKPEDLDAAYAYLRMLNGRTHSVYTGLSLVDCDSRKSCSSHEKTLVKFRNLTELEIDQYLRRIDPLDKAGAYAIQGEGALIVEYIKGCYYNVVGFPVAKLETMLSDFGISLFEYIRR